jgi:hypothetical protein
MIPARILVSVISEVSERTGGAGVATATDWEGQGTVRHGHHIPAKAHHGDCTGPHHFFAQVTNDWFRHCGCLCDDGRTNALVYCAQADYGIEDALLA